MFYKADFKGLKLYVLDWKQRFFQLIKSPVTLLHLFHPRGKRYKIRRFGG